MPSPTDRTPKLAASFAIIAGALGGCTTAADFSYGEYRFGPGFETGHVYESRVYGGTGRGFGTETCRTVVRRQVDEFGQVFAREIQVCDEP